MSKDMGASAKADRATRPTDQAPAGLGDTASVPSATDWKREYETAFRNLTYLADCLAASAYNAAEAKRTSKYERERQMSICDAAIRALQGVPVWKFDRGAATVIDRLYRARTEIASAIEARSAETSGSARKGESAVAKPDAKKDRP